MEGAVGMVEMALQMLSQHEVVHLDEERKRRWSATCSSCCRGERSAQPVVNTGTIYS
ncbi:MAG: hypothetical protein R3B70_41735 [Polyangiaceae bacterium]